MLMFSLPNANNKNGLVLPIGAHRQLYFTVWRSAIESIDDHSTLHIVSCFSKQEYNINSRKSKQPTKSAGQDPIRENLCHWFLVSGLRLPVNCGTNLFSSDNRKWFSQIISPGAIFATDYVIQPRNVFMSSQQFPIVHFVEQRHPLDYNTCL